MNNINWIDCPKCGGIIYVRLMPIHDKFTMESIYYCSECDWKGKI